MGPKLQRKLFLQLSRMAPAPHLRWLRVWVLHLEPATRRRRWAAIYTLEMGLIFVKKLVFSKRGQTPQFGNMFYMYQFDKV